MIGQFVQKYYIDPVLYGTGYNIVNTLTYAALFIALAFGTYRLLTSMRVRIDRNFLFSILPYIALGGMLRSLEDFYEASGVARNFLFITPLIYIVVFAAALASLAIALLLEKYIKVGYHKTWLVIGIAACAAALSQMRFTNYFAVYAMIGISAAWIVLFFGIKLVSKSKKIKKLGNFLSQENTLLLDVHMFDATTTFVALTFFPYFEQHVLPSFLISIFGPAVMFALKLGVVSALLYFFDKDVENAQQRTFLKIAVLVLGLGPGLRNFLRLAMGV